MNYTYLGEDNKYYIRIGLGDKQSMVIGPYPTEDNAKDGLSLIETYRKVVFDKNE